MTAKANLGTNRAEAVRVAHSLNRQHRLEVERKAARIQFHTHPDAVSFETGFSSFVERYIKDYSLKSSTATLLRQRRDRLISKTGTIGLAAIDTELLRETISTFSPFEQSKVKSLLHRFFKYAMSTGTYPTHLPNPVTNLYLDPVPQKRRARITMQQFKAIYDASPEWLQWLLTLAFHLALRRVDLVNLRFDDIVYDRIVSPIRKTDTSAREIESTSVDFPIHPDVRGVLTQARISSMANGRCPFVIHRKPDRMTKRSVDAVRSGAMQHPAQVLPQYASKAFQKARTLAVQRTDFFDGVDTRHLPTLHEVRALASHLYATAGYDVGAVQDLMAHTDPEMTRAYQKGHARKVLRVEMTLPFSIHGNDHSVREARVQYRVLNENLLENIL
ncbi:MAG: tyrosine-type recombinase/integrase [Gammaproteobacteria bacterium]|nr:tyrosine-type recombinase/integrase [Gammaproteobacteria bacterium]